MVDRILTSVLVFCMRRLSVKSGYIYDGWNWLMNYLILLPLLKLILFMQIDIHNGGTK